MKAYTVGDVMDYKVAEGDSKAVYVVYDSENFPLYVGQSKDVCLRLRQHIDSAHALPDGIGSEIVKGEPQSMSWKFEVYPTENLLSVEREMIKQLRPAINIVHN